MFKIDYLDRELSMHSPDPVDLSVTKRVIPTMLAEESLEAQQALDDHVLRQSVRLVAAHQCNTGFEAENCRNI